MYDVVKWKKELFHSKNIVTSHSTFPPYIGSRLLWVCKKKKFRPFLAPSLTFAFLISYSLCKSARVIYVNTQKEIVTFSCHFFYNGICFYAFFLNSRQFADYNKVDFSSFHVNVLNVHYNVEFAGFFICKYGRWKNTGRSRENRLNRWN